MTTIDLGISTSGRIDTTPEAAPEPAAASDQEFPSRPRSLSPKDLDFTPRKDMVRWMSPKQLSATAVQVLLSTLFGAYSDKREIQAALSSSDPVSYADERDVWVDYVADLGDGFGPTYAIASLLARRHLRLDGTGDTPTTIPRGRMLVMGGDQVYPVASIDAYRDRTLGPYRAALPYSSEDSPPHLFAVPGNHDWYDGLTSFMRLFCREQWIGGWKTKQRRSYFAVQVRDNWWVWGIDIQFDTYIDQPQFEYFEELARTSLKPGDSVVLCSAMPSWVCANQDGDPEAFATLDYFEQKIIRDHEAEVRLSLAGDAHHYARYVAEDGAQRVTAGGGGAFLAATHNLPDSLVLPPAAPTKACKTTPPAKFTLEATYPSKEKSRRLSWRVLGLPFQNWSMWALIGTVQLLLAWVLQAAVRSDPPTLSGAGAVGAPDLSTVMPVTSIPSLAAAIWGNPVAMVLSLAVIWGFSGFIKSKVPWKRLVGALHGVLQLAVAIVGIAVASRVLDRLGLEHGWFLAGFVVLVGVGGGLLGSWLLAWYLLFADRCLHCNANELFAAQRNRDYKNFLRIHFNSAGGVTVYPVKVARTPRHWALRQSGAPDDPWLEPDGPLTAELIEEPFVILPKTTHPDPDRDYAEAGNRTR